MGAFSWVFGMCMPLCTCTLEKLGEIVPEIELKTVQCTALQRVLQSLDRVWGILALRPAVQLACRG